MTRLALTLAILLASALPAWGQEQCYEYRTVVENLAKLHGEHWIGAGTWRGAGSCATRRSRARPTRADRR